MCPKQGECTSGRTPPGQARPPRACRQAGCGWFCEREGVVRGQLRSSGNTQQSAHACFTRMCMGLSLIQSFTLAWHSLVYTPPWMDVDIKELGVFSELLHASSGLCRPPTSMPYTPQLYHAADYHVSRANTHEISLSLQHVAGRCRLSHLPAGSIFPASCPYRHLKFVQANKVVVGSFFFQ